MTGRLAVLAAFGLLAVAERAAADIPPPPPPRQTVTVTIEIDENAKEPRLLIPRQLVTPRGGVGRPRPPEEEQADAGPALPRLHLIAAGLALTLAFTSGGLWLVRRGRVSGRAMMIAAGAVVLAGAAAVWADVGFPRPPRPNPPPAPVAPTTILLSEPVTVELVNQGDTIRLIGTKAMIEKIRGTPVPPPRQKPD
jgi:hypothetical protein